MRKADLVRFILLFTCSAAIFGSCQTEEQLKYARYYTNGKKLYDVHCANCHNADGSGLQSLIPPLTDTSFLSRHKNRLACIIKYGMHEKIMVAGKSYDDPMPPNPQLPDIDIAALVTYITNTFGNKQGLYEGADATRDLKNCAKGL